MKELVNYLVNSILNEDKVPGKTALFGGGFKPPTKGHLEVILQGLKDYPEVDEVYVFVGSGVRNNISQEEAIQIWEMYKKLIPVKTTIVKSGSPLKDIKAFIEDREGDVPYVFIGAREGNEEDIKDVAERSKFFVKYGGEPKTITTPDSEISGTKARAAAKVSKEAFLKFIPDQLTDEEKNTIYSYIQSVVTEIEGKEIEYWATHADLFSMLQKGIKSYAELAKQVSGKRKEALDYFYNTYFNLTESVDFKSLEKVLDDMFEDLDIDINFTKHFKERVIERGLTEEDIIELMEKIHDQYGDEVADLYKDENRVFTHLKRLVDIAAVNAGYGEDYLKDLVLKTAYKRQDKSEPEFRTNSTAPKLAVNENASYSKEIDIKGKIDELTQHMIAKGMNIEPLPSVEFVDGDTENARDFFGKTAYYDPNTQTVVLYTEGRHPKDIVRSYAHEMIHHIQNLEGRLGNITTTNTQEDDALNDLEAEANLKGTMTFRNWTDSLNEIGDASAKTFKWEESDDTQYEYAALFTTDSETRYEVGFDVLDGVEFEGNTYKLLESTFAATPKGDRTDSVHVVVNKGEVFKVMATITQITKHFVDSLDADGIVYTPSLKKGEQYAGSQRDKLYQAFITKAYPNAEIHQEGTSMIVLLPKGGLKTEVEDVSLDKDKNKGMASLYTIYLDMDGVIVDFDKQFKKEFGMPPGEFKDAFGVEKFWDKITEKGVGFWRGMEWMPGGEELYNHVSQYDHYLLSAPSQDESSKIGKRLWRRDNTPNTRLILASAKNKPNYADRSNILIDDRKDTIDAWEAAGGIGIHYTSAAQAMKELDKLGL